MATKENKRIAYSQARKVCDCDQSDWARLFNLGSEKGQDNVSRKESGVRGVNMPEVLASELLKFLYNNGYNVKEIKFDSNGRIANIPKK